jgi:hypothetical protein
MFLQRAMVGRMRRSESVGIKLVRSKIVCHAIGQ